MDASHAVQFSTVVSENRHLFVNIHVCKLPMETNRNKDNHANTVLHVSVCIC